jgi:hypothetical protein
LIVASLFSISSNASWWDEGKQSYAVLTIFGLANAGYYRLQGSYLGYPEMGSASIRPTPPA